MAAPVPFLSRLHLLPFAESDKRLEGKPRLESIAPVLRKLRDGKEVVRMGDLITHDNIDFAVIKCEPESGYLSKNTDYFLDGSPLVSFAKIQFSAWGPVEKTSAEIFQECIGPYCRGAGSTDEYGPYGASKKRVRLFYCNQTIKVGELYLQVEATEPAGLGVVTIDTEIFANWDETPEFEKVHVVPFQDTLPRAYEYDVFTDYLKPYLQCNAHKKFQANDLFTYHGVQFKMVACEPNVKGRIGKGSTIYCEGVLHPSLRNLLPPDLLNQVAQLPPGLQMLLLNTERTTRELEDILTQRRGLFAETLADIEEITWPPQDTTGPSQSTCMICLEDFEIADKCRRLPCRHVFHVNCVDEWLRRCTDCPICKDNVDRAIRHY